MFLFLMGPPFVLFMGINWLTQAFSYLPTHHYGMPMDDVLADGGFRGISEHLVNMSIWMMVSMTASFVLYRPSYMSHRPNAVPRELSIEAAFIYSELYSHDKQKKEPYSKIS